MRTTLTLLTLVLCHVVNAQSFHVGVFTGISNYQGDLTNKVYGSTMMKPAAGLGLEYEFSDRFSLRSGLTYGKLAGDDKKNNVDLRPRNLNFTTNLYEFSLLGEYRVLNISDIGWTPYFFTGMAFYNFDPYTKDAAGNKVFLQPLSTEGQGLPQYPERKPYATTQFAIPLGAGFKYAINDDVRVAFEMGLRKLFTDYIDDVSSFYADEADLLAARGPKAVEMAYRGDELPGGNPAYPQKGDIRGGAKQNDWYYFTGVRVTFRLGGGYSASTGNSKRNVGCPVIKE